MLLYILHTVQEVFSMQFIAGYYTKSLYIIIENNISFQAKTDRRHATFCPEHFRAKRKYYL